MVGYIYLITDTTNGMQYVGQHHYDKEELDSNYHGSGRIISRIYKKRPHTLKEEYLKTCYSQYELDEWEKYFIFSFNTLSPNGYNLEEGGKGGKPSEETKIKMSIASKGKHPTEEVRKKMSESHKGKTCWNKGMKMSEEHKRKLSESHKGQIPPNKGKHHTEEARKKMSESHKGKPAHNKGIPMSEEQKKKMRNDKRSKKVLQFTLSGEFIREWPSVMECGRNGFDKSHVAACCNGKQKSHKGFIFKYK